jgi:holliday junction DNA helicase RuvA
MIATLNGKVAEKDDKYIILDVHGVGYRVATLSLLRNKVQVGADLSLRIYHRVGSDAEELYGFEEKEGLDFFELLITVPSVGPRTAIGILEVAPPRVLEQAVAEENTDLLTKVSGVGRKTAERILVELKGKVEAPIVAGIAGGVQQDTIEALVSIGYTAGQARSVVQKLPKEIVTVEAAVKAALQQQS